MYFLAYKYLLPNLCIAKIKFYFMKNENKISEKKSINDEIQFFIKRKKEENSALKKLLTALENAKRNTAIKNHA